MQNQSEEILRQLDGMISEVRRRMGGELWQALHNLLINAVEAITDGMGEKEAAALLQRLFKRGGQRQLRR
ncbi:MAG TPA: hypothetical protein VHN12_04035 [Geobacteraceae bacterium]|nr:hypothetical protein [Geobacteraceae bacterium]